MVCPTGPGGFVFQWFAQRVWRGFRIFFAMVCRGFVFQLFDQRVWRGFVFFFNGLPNGPGGIRFSMVRPTGLEGFWIFFNGLPNGSGGVSEFFFNGLPNGPEGDSFFNGSPNRSHLGRFGWDLPRLRSRGPCQGRGALLAGPSPGSGRFILAKRTLAIQVWLRGSPRAPRAPGRDPPRLRSVGHPGHLGHLGVSYGRARLRLTSTIKRTQFFTCRSRTSTRPHCLP